MSHERSPRAVADVVEFSCVDGPGNRFVVFLQGCNFDCIACHNPHTIPLHGSRAVTSSVDDSSNGSARSAPLPERRHGLGRRGDDPGTVRPRASSRGSSTIPTSERLTTFVDSNGSAPPSVWESCARDGRRDDRPEGASTPTTHDLLTGRPNDPVLRSIELLAEAGKLYEVRLLLVPGFNDDEEAIGRAGRLARDRLHRRHG